MRYVLIALFGCVHPPPAGHAVVAEPTSATKMIPIVVTSAGFEPNSIDVELGQSTTLMFTRKVARTCVKRVVVSLDDVHNIERDLPIDVRVAITLTFDHVGELGFSCAMAMRGGAIHVIERPHSTH